MTARILFVDDEPNVLAGLGRLLRRRYAFDTAEGGHAGLELMASHDYAVVVSDMRMPHMSGEDFLAEANELQPEAVQMILSGQANLESTVAAVNGGNIFRFLVKPLATDALTSALDSAIEQHRLVTAERELLQQTLSGAVGALGEVLALASPAASRRTRQVVSITSVVAPALDLGDDWQLRLAAMLSGIGYAAVPGDVLRKLDLGQPLDDTEQAMVGRHPEVTGQLLGHIPRLDGVAAIIRAQAGAIDVPDGLGDHVLVLDFAINLAGHLLAGRRLQEAIGALAVDGRYPRALIERAQEAADARRATVRQVEVGALRVGMILKQDLRTVTKVMLAAEDTPISRSLLEGIRNFHTSVGVVSPITVEVTETT